MLVSVIIPTCDRRHLLPLALAAYASQDWPEKELVVIDDGQCDVRDLVQGIPGVTYIRVAVKQSIGRKRNLACEVARGELIAHWDDDDWSCPTRLSEHVALLGSSGRSVTGYNQLYVYDQRFARAYLWKDLRSNYACGASLCYRRSLWEVNRFPDKNHGEDNDFWKQTARQTIAADGRQSLVVRVHGSNTSSGDRVGHNSWPLIPLADLPAGFRAVMGIA